MTAVNVAGGDATSNSDEQLLGPLAANLMSPTSNPSPAVGSQATRAAAGSQTRKEAKRRKNTANGTCLHPPACRYSGSQCCNAASNSDDERSSQDSNYSAAHAAAETAVEEDNDRLLALADGGRRLWSDDAVEALIDCWGIVHELMQKKTEQEVRRGHREHLTVWRTFRSSGRTAAVVQLWKEKVLPEHSSWKHLTDTIESKIENLTTSYRVRREM
jgi:hypothetical protein